MTTGNPARNPSDMEQFTIDRADRAPLTFTGELIAKAASHPDRAHDGWSGQTGRWQTLALYRTVAGRYVCQSTRHTMWQGESDTCEAEAVGDPAGIVAFFGHSWLAKLLYRKAGFDFAEHVE